MAQTIEIDSLAVDRDREVLFYGYRLVDDGIVVASEAFSLDGEDYEHAKVAVDTIANAAAQAQADAGQPISLDIFAIIETALERGAKIRLGIE